MIRRLGPDGIQSRIAALQSRMDRNALDGRWIPHQPPLPLLVKARLVV